MAYRCIETNSVIRGRAKYFETFGIKVFDAAHLACAENNADVLLTVDGGFLTKSGAIQDLRVKAMNPLQWLEEVLK